MHTSGERRRQAGQALADFAMVLAMVAIIVLVVVLFLSGKLQAAVDAIGSH
jgi:hypothetical protein